MLEVLDGLSYKIINELGEDISGGKINFDNAVQLEGWIFRWNGEGVKGNDISGNGMLNEQKKENNLNTNQNIANKDFTLMKIISLALVDAINPCALAVLLLMLTSILAYSPKDKRNLILSGFAFIFSIFIMYLFYGLVIIKFIKLVQLISSLRIWVYNFFGGLAIVLGFLNIKDYIFYKPGSVGTEMPLFMRPKVKSIIEKITSPFGAFSMGIFVTLFLLPCTIGPYIICCGLLSVQNIVNSLPMLLLYNFIFVLPMIFILAFVVFGLRKVEDVSVWKENNIHKLHLVEGIIMLSLGLVMLLGWI
jgi:cytochrome c biogenesis protein CcdA